MANRSFLRAFDVGDGETAGRFERIGHRTILLNARKIYRPGNRSELILLAFEDVTERRAAARRLPDHESRFRLIFQSVRDFSSERVLHRHHRSGRHYHGLEHGCGKRLRPSRRRGNRPIGGRPLHA
jgi:PAS domain-containing protein